MTTAALPIPLSAPASGWTFEGAWRAADQALIEQTLRERIPNPARARDDPWVFLVHAATYYAHSSAYHSPNVGFIARTAGDLAELLWDHYFSLHLGPLAWSPPAGVAPPAMLQTMPAEDVQRPVDPLVVSLEHEWQALHHFETARALLAEGDYAAAKLELELSLALHPATTFFDHKRVETLGDIESSLGNDAAALWQYQQALELALEWKESWVHTELRLKLAWVLLRRGQVDAARELVETALATCQDGATDAADRRGLNYATALALATLADVQFHQHAIDAAVVRARQAAAVASRLGQAYAEKVRLLTYLAWQLYQHDETTEARALAQRAQAALDRWMPLDARYVRSLRTTLATILGPSQQRNERTPRVALPAHGARVVVALAAVRAMQDWLRQLIALHSLAPYLTLGQVIGPLTDILVWSEDFLDEQPYRIVLTADLAHALADPEQTISVAADQLGAIEPHTFRMLGFEWLYAESLVRMRGQLEAAERKRIEAAIVACALAWCNTIQGRIAGDVRVDVLSGLAVLLPYLPREVRQSGCVVMEDALLAQLDPQNSLYPTAFLACLPVLARCGTGQRIVDAILQRERQSVHLWIACLAHIDAEDTHESIVETALRWLENRLTQGSSTEVAEVLCWLAPYLRGEQARRALALATSVRSISPRVQALAAIARAMPDDEAQIVYDTAWKAAQRSTSVDVRGEALAAIVVSMASPKFGHNAADESSGDDPLVA
jgi:tetratricopeptide (TPR) repeat protein